MHEFSATADRVLHPPSLHRPTDVNRVPSEKGIYAWLFTHGRLPVPDAPYAHANGFDLLYVGIAPKKPSSKGKESASRLRSRIRSHCKGDASRSTLRLTLGVLLAEELNLSLGIHKGRLNWGADGEVRLTGWINAYARMTWVEIETPWVVEDELLLHATVALNIDGRTDAFSHELRRCRDKMRRSAGRAAAAGF